MPNDPCTPRGAQRCRARLPVPPAAVRPRPVRLLPALLPLLAVAAQTLAATPATDTVTLGPVIITGSTPDDPLKVEVDAKAPRQPVPAQDGADLLKTIPGFSVIRKGGSNGDPLLRGMAGSRLGLLFDGGQLGGGCPARMDPGTAYIVPALYDRVVITKGPQTVLHGPGNSAGSVRFERDPPQFDAARLDLQGSVLGGNWGRFDQWLDVLASNPHGYVGLAANHTRSGDYADGDGARVHSHYDRWSADARVGWIPAPGTRVELSVGSGDGEAAYAFSGMDGVRFRRDSTAVSFEHNAQQGWLESIEARLYSNRADHVMDNYTLRQPDPHGPMPMAMASNVDRRIDGGRVLATASAGPLALQLGADASDEQHRVRSGGPAGSPMGDWRAQARLRDARITQAGVFGEAAWDASAHARLVAGLRTDRVAATGYLLSPEPERGHGDHDDDHDHGDGHDHDHGIPDGPHLRAQRSRWQPAAFLRWEQHLEAGGRLHAGIGHVQRFPDYWELFGRFAESSVGAFRGLRPERTKQLDVGWERRGAHGHAWLSAYAGAIRDFILIQRSDGLHHIGGARNVRARIAGAEAGAMRALSPVWSVDASLAWAWGENRSDQRPLPQMPPLEARFGITRDNGNWALGALARVVAAQNRVAPGTGNIVGQDLGPSPGFAVFSLNGGRRLGERLRLTGGIDNVFDRRYAEHVNAASVELTGYAPALRVNEPGRTAWLELRLAL